MQYGASLVGTVQASEVQFGWVLLSAVKFGYVQFGAVQFGTDQLSAVHSGAGQVQVQLQKVQVQKVQQVQHLPRQSASSPPRVQPTTEARAQTEAEEKQ